MFNKPKRLAPEPYFSAATQLLYRVALFIRNSADSISPEQLSDLGDATHNIPESLVEYGYYFDEQKIRDLYLSAYDSKWAQSPDDFSLIRHLDGAIQNARAWHEKTGEY